MKCTCDEISAGHKVNSAKENRAKVMLYRHCTRFAVNIASVCKGAPHLPNARRLYGDVASRSLYKGTAAYLERAQISARKRFHGGRLIASASGAKLKDKTRDAVLQKVRVSVSLRSNCDLIITRISDSVHHSEREP